jgi:WXG100 family type VII secretion target
MAIRLVVDNFAKLVVIHTYLKRRGRTRVDVRTVPPHQRRHRDGAITGGRMTMTNGLKVSPHQLSALGGSCNRTATDVRGQHNALKAQLSPLFGADWSGAAATQFAGLYEQFTKSAEGLSSALDGIGRLLSQAGQNYAAVEQQIASSFHG